MIRLSQRTIDPSYYVYWRLLGFKSCGKLSHIFVISKDWNFAQKKWLKDWFSEFETNWFHFSIPLQWKFWPSDIHSTNEKTALAMLRALMLIEMFAEIWNSQILVRVLKSDNLQYNTQWLQKYLWWISSLTRASL